jgi:hypothetical protein
MVKCYPKVNPFASRKNCFLRKYASVTPRFAKDTSFGSDTSTDITPLILKSIQKRIKSDNDNPKMEKTSMVSSSGKIHHVQNDSRKLRRCANSRKKYEKIIRIRYERGLL